MNLSIFSKEKFKHFGRKALIMYLCWCIVKGLVFLFVGASLMR